MIRLPSGLIVERDIPLKSLTSWLVGGAADWLVQPRNLEELKEALALARLAGLAPTILAGGTNVLIADSGIRGLTIALRKFSQTSTEELEVQGARRLAITCLSGTSKSELLKTFLKNRLEPALFLAGLPGDVGGGVVMNAGVGEAIRPREFVEITDWIEVLRWRDDFDFSAAHSASHSAAPSGSLSQMHSSGSSLSISASRSQSTATLDAFSNIRADEISRVAGLLEVRRLQSSDLVWSYRHCEGWRPGVIVRVGMSWDLAPSEDILARVKQANHVRLSKQPLDMPSCGSVFINPPGHKAGQLVESAGLKGFAIGGAKVSEKHANFIVNHSDASALDIHRVIEHVRATVLTIHGIRLRTEVVYLGDWSSASPIGSSSGS